MGLLDGKVAIVTGAGGGLGRSHALQLAREGALLVINDLGGARDGVGTSSAAAEMVAEEIRAAGGKAVADFNNVATQEGAAGIAKSALDAFGRIDILVNNAGIGVPAAERKTVDAFSLQAWNDLIRIDLTGLFLMSREVSRAMRAQKAGRIINIASVLGMVPARLQSAYIAAKAGVVNLTKSMALELAPDGVLVNAVAPGSTQTQGWETWIRDAGSEAQDLHAKLMSHIPLGRPGTTQEMANAVLFLAAPESSYITGHVLTVDGGWTAGFSRDF